MPFSPSDGLLWYAVFVGSSTCHEAGHAWAALKLGDDTASKGGQVSLNPWPHIRREPIGMVVIPILTWISGGWLMGWASAPYDPKWAREYPRRCALMALAGPAANLALVGLAALLIRVGIEWNVFTPPHSIGMSHITADVSGGIWAVVAETLSIVFSLNLLLCLFNLLPIPPLDGGSVPLLVLPEDAARGYFDAMRHPMLRVIGFMIVARGLGDFFVPVLRWSVGLLYPGHHYI